MAVKMRVCQHSTGCPQHEGEALGDIFHELGSQKSPKVPHAPHRGVGQPPAGCGVQAVSLGCGTSSQLAGEGALCWEKAATSSTTLGMLHNSADTVGHQLVPMALQRALKMIHHGHEIGSNPKGGKWSGSALAAAALPCGGTQQIQRVATEDADFLLLCKQAAAAWQTWGSLQLRREQSDSLNLLLSEAENCSLDGWVF